MLIKNGYGLEYGCISLSAGYLSASTYRKYLTVRTFFCLILLYLLCPIDIFWNLFFWDFFYAEKYALLCFALLCSVLLCSTLPEYPPFFFLLFSFPPHWFSFLLSSFLLFVFSSFKSVSQLVNFDYLILAICSSLFQN